MFAARRLPHLLPILTAASLFGAASSAIAADVSPWDDDLQVGRAPYCRAGP
jgi:hypothetical protein